MGTKRIGIVGMISLVALALALPVSAGEGDRTLRAGILYSSPTSDLSEAGQTTELDAGFGIQGSYEWMVTDSIGVEPGASYVQHDVTVSEAGFPDIDFGETDWFAVTVNGNYHFMEESTIDLYAGPTLGYVFWGSIKSDLFPIDFEADDGFVFGVNLGVDVPIGDGPWAFSAALSYLFTDLEIEGGAADIGVDPIQLKIGAGFRF